MVADHYRSDGILAVQGPLSRDLLSKLFSEVSTLTAMHLTSVNYQNQSVIVSQTGYTGEEGFEIFAKQDVIVLLWDRLLEEGQSFGIEPIGLGARDTLRMEMGYALYGHEISGEILPNESVSAWTIKWQKKEFLGKTALEMLESSSNKRFEYGIVLQDKGIAREGYPIFHQGAMIGKVTSGTLSPSLNQAVAIVLVERNLKEGDSVEVQIRQNKCMAKVVRLPFYRKSRS
jgi:aminomethyltransferase